MSLNSLDITFAFKVSLIYISCRFTHFCHFT